MRPKLLATRFTKEQDFYTGRLRDRHGIEPLVPNKESRALVHRVIYEELCRGELRPKSKAAYIEQIEHLRRAGADSAILSEAVIADVGGVSIACGMTSRCVVDRHPARDCQSDLWD